MSSGHGVHRIYIPLTKVEEAEISAWYRIGEYGEKHRCVVDVIVLWAACQANVCTIRKC
jgi:hypothetical protein